MQGQRPQTHPFGRTATGISSQWGFGYEIIRNMNLMCDSISYEYFLSHKRDKPETWHRLSHLIVFWTERDMVVCIHLCCRSHWPRVLRREYVAAGLLGLRVRISPWAWMSASCECCVLSVRALCDGPITLPEESYWVWDVWVWYRSLDNEAAPAH